MSLSQRQKQVKQRTSLNQYSYKCKSSNIELVLTREFKVVRLELLFIKERYILYLSYKCLLCEVMIMGDSKKLLAHLAKVKRRSRKGNIFEACLAFSFFYSNIFDILLIYGTSWL